MIKKENNCVGCPPEMGCMGNSCPYMNVERVCCDNCDNDAEYRIDGNEFCYDCAREYLKSMFDDLSIEEQADMLEYDLEEIDDNE